MTQKELIAKGFVGFKTISELWHDTSSLPNEMGVYVVLNPTNFTKKFLARGVGGFFKGKDPNVSEGELHDNWIENAEIVYVGKAGGRNTSATLKKRLKQYLDFGQGKPIGHYGGRFIWQVKYHPELVVAWKVLKDEEPVAAERQLLNEFSNFYGKLPFANLR